ncbi:hypothetical protein SDC9_202251 [bioreactor metagenome]|uniref:Uncharacterized protein n=1 Tax=bioreactor metagenome TaxID=1076179 RepID=A0A645IUL7_9ZZZZ
MARKTRQILRMWNQPGMIETIQKVNLRTNREDKSRRQMQRTNPEANHTIHADHSKAPGLITISPGALLWSGIYFLWGLGQ